MKTSLTVLFIIFTSFLNAQNDSIKINTKNIIYKNINGYDLNMKVISSKDNKNSKTAKQQSYDCLFFLEEVGKRDLFLNLNTKLDIFRKGVWCLF